MYWKSTVGYAEKERDGFTSEGSHTRYGKYRVTARVKLEWALLQFKVISARSGTELSLGMRSTRRIPGNWIKP